MKTLATFKNDEHFNDGISSTLAFEGLREAVRVVVLDRDGNVAMVGGKNLGLPGGGVEKGEELRDSVKRECMEEIGCEVEIIDELGMIEDYRPLNDDRHHTYGFMAKVVGEKGQRSSTQEDEKDDKVMWLPPAEALANLKNSMATLIEQNKYSYFTLRAGALLLEAWMGEGILKQQNSN